jgi:hypothetical protein
MPTPLRHAARHFLADIDVFFAITIRFRHFFAAITFSLFRYFSCHYAYLLIFFAFIAADAIAAYFADISSPPPRHYAPCRFIFAIFLFR